MIQMLWELECKKWEQVVADIEVCMLYKGKGPRSLTQNQRFIMLLAFGLRVVAQIVAIRLTSHAESNSLIVKEQYGFRSKHSVLGPVLVLTLCIEDAVRITFNPENDPFTCVFADMAKAYLSVPRPEFMAVLEKSGVPSKFSNIIRGLMEHAKNSEGHSDRWFNMSLGLKEGCPATPIEFSILPLNRDCWKTPMKVFVLVFGSEECKSACKNSQMGKNCGANVEDRQSLLFADDTTSLCRRSNMQNRKDLLKQTFKDRKLILER